MITVVTTLTARAQAQPRHFHPAGALERPGEDFVADGNTDHRAQHKNGRVEVQGGVQITAQQSRRHPG